MKMPNDNRRDPGQKPSDALGDPKPNSTAPVDANSTPATAAKPDSGKRLVSDKHVSGGGIFETGKKKLVTDKTVSGAASSDVAEKKPAAEKPARNGTYGGKKLVFDKTVSGGGAFDDSQKKLVDDKTVSGGASFTLPRKVRRAGGMNSDRESPDGRRSKDKPQAR